MSASSLPLPQGKSVSLKQFVSRHINEIGLLVVIAILYLVFSLNAPGFISLNNQMNVLRDAATIGIAAWAMTLIIISGEIDVSVGPMVAFVSVCLAFLLQFEVPLAIACLLVLLLGALMGTLAGVLRGVFNVPSFVATLGLWSALRGMGLFMTNALPVPIDENEVLDWLGGQFLGVPVSALIMIVLFALFVFISRKTAFGRSVFAVGGNATAAQLCGINVRRVRILIFTLSGLLAAVTGILLAARLGSGNAGAANGLEFDVIAAVVVGGTALSGGRGSLFGTLLGVLVITLIGNGLVLLGINSFFQQVVRGVIIVVAVLAAYLPGNSTVDLREVAVPTPGINQVLIKMKSSGICGSDVHYIYHQHRATAAAPDKPLYQGFINGHEPCGQIVAMGQGCRHFKEGDRVLVYHISGCGFCPNCRRGFPISCTGKGKAAYGWQRDGGHAEYLLAEEKDLILLPDALSYEDGAFISCGVGTAYEGILRGEVSGSDNVLVVGLGPVGMMAMMLAKGRGAKRIIGVDMLPERLAMAKQLGVMDHGYLATTEGLPQIIAELTHGGADVALDCSGNAAGRLLALQSTADWGRVVYIGETGKVEFEVSADLMHHQRRIIGSWVTSLFHMEKCAHDLTEWKLWPRNAITHRFSLEQAGDAYALMASGKCGKVVINFPD